ncbi:MAG: SPOR domain-containing protein [Hyphomicrobium sp.]
MSRSQGAANNGWPPQRQPAAEPDPRTAGRPAQRPQAPAPQYSVPQQPAGYPPQGYGEQQAQQPAAYNPQPQHQPQAQHQAYHYPQQPAPHYPPQQQAPAAPPPGRQALSSLDSARNAQPTHDFENFPRTQPPQYTRPPQQAPQRAQYAPPAVDNPINAAMGYRQAPAQPAPQYAPPRPAAPAYDAWPAPQATHDPYGQGSADYGEAAYPAHNGQQHFDQLQQADWASQTNGYGDPGHDQQAYGRGGQLGYDQPHRGALEPTYNQDEAAYEAEEPRRRSWTMRIAGAVVVAIGLGYGLAQAYKSLIGTPPDTTPPVIASDASPAKEKPVDPGGRQFSHPDSKVLGRLGENGAEAPADSGGGLSESDADSNGARQVKTLVVGRDGSIGAPPPADSTASEPESVSVPGLTVVDAFGSAAQQPAPQRVAAEPAHQREPEAAVEAPPQRSGVNVKTTRVIPSSTASIPDQEPAAAPAPRKQKVATAAPTNDAGASAGSGGANGYVVVLASVPASGSSRLDALRKFADMQQQYGSVLASKTPDVRETTLPGKGPYHRLLVGPPGSRSQANELCTQLKAYGYKDCWVTAY